MTRKNTPVTPPLRRVYVLDVSEIEGNDDLVCRIEDIVSWVSARGHAWVSVKSLRRGTKLRGSYTGKPLQESCQLLADYLLGLGLPENEDVDLQR